MENRPRSESNDTRPPNAMVKNAWSYTSTHRKHFSFTLLFTSPLTKHTIIYVASLLTRSVQQDPRRLWAYTDEQYFCIDATALVHLPVLRLGHRVILQRCLHALQTYPSITDVSDTACSTQHIMSTDDPAKTKTEFIEILPTTINYHNHHYYWLRSK